MELKQFKIAVLPLREKLLNYARKLTDDPSDAEDAVQEVMLKLWNMRQRLDEYRSIEALAMTMTHHLCMDIWRARRPDALSLDQVQAPSQSATPERLLEEKDEFRLMREIIDSLPTSATYHHTNEGRAKSTKQTRLRKSPDVILKLSAATCPEHERKLETFTCKPYKKGKGETKHEYRRIIK